MKSRFTYIKKPSFRFDKRILDVDIRIPKIRAKFYVRLYTLLEHAPLTHNEGYEFFIKDEITGKQFSAGLTGFGPGYFAVEKSEEMTILIDEFHEFLFEKLVNLKECQIEIEHDFGKSVLGYKNEQIIEIDIEE